MIQPAADRKEEKADNGEDQLFFCEDGSGAGIDAGKRENADRQENSCSEHEAPVNRPEPRGGI